MLAARNWQRNRSDRRSRFICIGCEQLEARMVLDGSGFAGNPCAPDLDLSAVTMQTAVVGQQFTLDLIAAGATVEDLDGSGQPTNLPFRFLLDPDVPSDTPTGASISEAGVFTWTPAAGQEGVHSIIVILVDGGSPNLADVEQFQVTVTAANPPNRSPDLAAIADATGAVGQLLEITITATDADGDLLTFALDPDQSPDGAVLQQVDNMTAIIRWTPQALDGPGPHTFVVTVTDDGSPSLADSETFEVTVTNNPATLDLNGAAAGNDFSTTFTEDGGAIVIVASDATINDDGDQLVAMRIVLTNLLDGNDESLSVQSQTGITDVYDPITGTLTLTGPASVSAFQDILRTLSYNNTSQNPTTTTRLITVEADDGGGLGPASEISVQVIAVAEAPNLILPAPFDVSDVPFEIILGESVEFTATASDDAAGLTFQLDPDHSGIAEADAKPTIDSQTGDFSWTPTATGCFMVTVIVTDADGLADQEMFLVLVRAAPAQRALPVANNSVVDPGANSSSPVPANPPSAPVTGSSITSSGSAETIGSASTEAATVEPNSAVIDGVFADPMFNLRMSENRQIDRGNIAQLAPEQIARELTTGLSPAAYRVKASTKVSAIDTGDKEKTEFRAEADLDPSWNPEVV